MNTFKKLTSNILQKLPQQILQQIPTINRASTIYKLENYANYIDDIMSNEQKFSYSKYCQMINYFESISGLDKDVMQYSNYIHETLEKINAREIRRMKLEKLRKMYE